MAMPTGGTIAMISAPNGLCSSICDTVCGNHPGGDRSLSGMTHKIGCGAPYKMSCFYSLVNDVIVAPNPLTSIVAAGATCVEKVCGPTWNSVDVVSNNPTWIVPVTPVSPAASPGANENVVICANTGAARSGTAVYTPQGSGTNTVTFCQLGVTWKCVDLCKTASSCGSAGACALNCFIYSSARIASECFSACISSALSAVGQAAGSWVCIDVCCNGSRLFCCVTTACSTPNCTFCVDYNDCINISLYACACNTSCANGSCGHVILTSVTCCSGCGYFCKGSLCSDVLACTG
jgi:hypothetical protein